MICVFESTNTFLVNIIEQALNEHGIACNVTGNSDVGLGNMQMAKIFVSESDEAQARVIVEQVS